MGWFCTISGNGGLPSKRAEISRWTKSLGRNFSGKIARIHRPPKFTSTKPRLTDSRAIEWHPHRRYRADPRKQNSMPSLCRICRESRRLEIPRWSDILPLARHRRRTRNEGPSGRGQKIVILSKPVRMDRFTPRCALRTFIVPNRAPGIRVSSSGHFAFLMPNLSSPARPNPHTDKCPRGFASSRTIGRSKPTGNTIVRMDLTGIFPTPI